MRKFGLFVAALAVFALAGQSADAASRQRVRDPRVQAVTFWTPIAATLAYLSLNDWRWHRHKTWPRRHSHGLTNGGAYLFTSVMCSAAAPIIATAVTNRALTNREAHAMVGSCFLPIIGGYLVEAMYDANPHWER